MKYEVAEFVKYDLDGDVSIRENYSGRAMWGKTTTGIVCDPYEMKSIKKSILNALGNGDVPEELQEGLEDILEDNYRSDNMGRDYIYY